MIIKIRENDEKEFVGRIIDIFDDFLEERVLRVPTSDAEMVDNGDNKDNIARIYGADYGMLEQKIEETLCAWSCDARKRPDQDSACCRCGVEKETKQKLLDMLLDISYGHEKAWENLEDDGEFWKAWSDMHKSVSGIETGKGKENLSDKDRIMLFELTSHGKNLTEEYIRELRAKRKEILDAGKDTADETVLPTVEDILSDIEIDWNDPDGPCCLNGWAVTDHYDADYPLLLKLGRDLILSVKNRSLPED